MLIDELEEIYQKRQAIEKLYYNILRKKKELGNIKAIDYSKEKLQGGQIEDGNKLLNDIIHNEELEERLTEHIQDLKLKQAFLYLKIDKLSKFLSNDIRLLLICRYVLGENWYQISSRLNLALTHIHRLHRKAKDILKNVDKIHFKGL